MVEPSDVTRTHIEMAEATRSAAGSGDVQGDLHGRLGTPAWRLPVPGDVVGDCEVVEELGRGGMGVVYKAVRRQLKRVVALKLLLPMTGPGADQRLQRFYVEAQSAASLDHPNIVRVYNIGEHDNATYIEMEHVQGQSLADLLKTGPLAEPEAVRLTIAAAEALGYAHARGLIHRDIKPANLLLRPDGCLKVSDFGLAGRARASQTQGADANRQGPMADATSLEVTRPGAVVGTLAYMSPQQYRAEPLDGRTDIYALGATLFTLLAGRPAYADGPVDTFMDRVFAQPVPDVRTLRPEVSAKISQAIMQAMAKDASERWMTCDALIQALAGPEAPGEAETSAGRDDQAFWKQFSGMVRGVRGD